MIASPAIICYSGIVVARALGVSPGAPPPERTMKRPGKEKQTKDQTELLQGLLGSLELELMEYMWQAGQATVRQAAENIGGHRPIAYTTVMTVMGHLVDKGLLSRSREKNRYRYKVAQDRQEFLYRASQRMIHTLVDDFGDLAVAGFLSEIGDIGPERLEELRRLGRQARGENKSASGPDL